jgi:hypothetical protein
MAFGVRSRAASRLIVWSHTVISGECGQRRLEGAAQAAERGRLFLCDFKSSATTTRLALPGVGRKVMPRS